MGEIISIKLLTEKERTDSDPVQIPALPFSGCDRGQVP